MNYTGTATTQLNINGTQETVPGIQKTESSVSTYVHKNQQMDLKGMMPGPSRVWLMLDGDPGGGNRPSELGNHGPAGLNVQFCDGHVEWIRPEKWFSSYEISQDEGGSDF